MPIVGFEPTIPVFERAKMVHACLRWRSHYDRHAVNIDTIKSSSIDLNKRIYKIRECKAVVVEMWSLFESSMPPESDSIQVVLLKFKESLTNEGSWIYSCHRLY
jgi:hypothetical protein